MAATGTPVVYLHIGSPKSGTTFVQQVMWHNRAALAEHGVLLPTGSYHSQQPAVWDLREMRRHPDDPARSWEGAWDQLAAEALAPGHRIAVISEESLCSMAPPKIDRALASLAPAEVRVIYTIRDLAGLLPSAWQEYVKHRSTQDFETWLGDVIDGGPRAGSGEWFWKVHDAVKVLARWSRNVPKDHVYVITMPPPGSPRDLLWRRFAGVLGVDADLADLSRAFPNQSLGQAETELLRRLNEKVDPEFPQFMYGKVVKEVLAHQILSKRGGDRPAVPQDRLPWLADRQKALVEGLRKAGYQVVGDLDDLLRAPARPPAASPDEAPSEAELLDAATDGLAGLVEEISRLRAELREQGRELRERRRELSELRAKPLHKVVVRRMSEHNAMVMRMRVAYWHARERRRGPEDAQ